MTALRILPLAILLAACVSTSTVPLSQDTFQITAEAEKACGSSSARQVAFKQASVETINRGYDKFIVLNTSASNNIRVVGTKPLKVDTTGRSTTVSGGEPIYGGSYNQDLIVKMFRYDDPEADRAIDARATLGPDWPQIIQKKTTTCL